MHSRRLMSIVVFFLAAIAVVVGVAMIRSGQPKASRTGDREPTEAEVLQAWDESLLRWSSIEKVPLAGASDESIVEEFELVLSSVDPALSEHLRRSLVERMVQETRLRSGDDPEAYLAFARSRPGERWISDREPKMWARENEMFLAALGRSFEPHEAMQAHELVVRDLFQRRGAVFKSIGRSTGFDDGGAIARSYRVRSEEQLGLQSSREFEIGSEAWRTWSMTGPTSAARRFRIATRSLDEVAREQGSVSVVEFRIIVETELGNLGVWRSTWYFDPKSNAWQLYSMGLSSRRQFTVWY